MLLRGPKTLPRQLQVPSEPSKGLPKRPNSAQNLMKAIVVCLLAFSLPMGLCGLKLAQESPKKVPRSPHDGPKSVAPIVTRPMGRITMPVRCVARFL